MSSRIYEAIPPIQKSSHNIYGNIKVEVVYDTNKGIINIKYYNKYIDCYDVNIVVYPFTILDAGIQDMIYKNAPRDIIKRNKKRNKIINDLFNEEG